MQVLPEQLTVPIVPFVAVKSALDTVEARSGSLDVNSKRIGDDGTSLPSSAACSHTNSRTSAIVTFSCRLSLLY